MMKRKASGETGVSLDQHFMTNAETVEKIVAVAGIKSGDIVLEIGAGTGVLTARLAARRAKVIAVEIDRGFSSSLGKLRRKNIEIIYANALDVIDGLSFTKVVSNIPYAICEPLIGKLAGRDLELALLTVPEGFCRRLSSRKGGILSLRTGCFFSIESIFKIPASDFSPPPRTGSVAMMLRPLSRADYLKVPEKFVFREIFLQKEKKLKNALMEALINLNKKVLSRDFTKRMSLELIKEMSLESRLLQKKPKEMRPEDFEEIEKKLRCFS